MTGHEHVGERHEAQEDLVLDPAIFVAMVGKEEGSFLLVHVQAEGGEFAGLEGRNDGLGIDQLAAGRVYQGRAGFEQGERAGVDEVVRVWQERAVQGDNVRLAEQAVEIVRVLASDRAGRVGELGAPEDVVPEHPTAEPAGTEDPGRRSPDLTRADDPYRLALQRLAEEALQS